MGDILDSQLREDLTDAPFEMTTSNHALQEQCLPDKVTKGLPCNFEPSQLVPKKMCYEYQLSNFEDY